MIVDSSALVAIARNEPETLALVTALSSSRARMSAPTFLEIGIVLDQNRRREHVLRFDDLLAEFAIEIVPFTQQQAELARAAFRDFGRGSGHPARLNFGDCISYAVAKDLREPLLYKGDDFSHTDVRSALDEA